VHKNAKNMLKLDVARNAKRNLKMGAAFAKLQRQKAPPR
jgi:hypothetical protein